MILLSENKKPVAGHYGQYGREGRIQSRKSNPWQLAIK
jgi:hypothetical protein